MKNETIQYKGKLYPARTIKGILVSTEILGDLLFNMETGEHTNEEAEALDNTIGYFCDKEEFKLSDKELYKKIYNEHK